MDEKHRIPSQAASSITEVEIEWNPSDEQNAKLELQPNAHQSVPNALPNGGLQAWLQVLGSFFLWFNTWGLINAYGVFQTYYSVDILKHESPSTIAWIGSVQSYLLLFVGALTGPVFDAGYFRTLLGTGSFLVVFGMMMTSIGTTYWQLFLAHAVCVGIGAGCLFVPSVALLSTYFSSRMTIATGLAAAGSGIGGTIHPIILHSLAPRIGFGWATRVLGFVVLASLAVPLLVMKVRLPPSSRRKLFDTTAWKNAAFTTYVVGTFIAFLGTWTPFFYIELYALSLDITTPTVAFYLLAVVTAGSVFGRLGPNFLAAKIGMFNVMIPCTIMTGVLSYCFIAVRSLGGIVVVGVLYGFFSGTLVSLVPAIPVQLTPNRALIGTRMGMAFATFGIGIILGTPISGELLKRFGFEACFAFSGTSAIVGSIILTVSREQFCGWSWKAAV